jgi:hypothetical protein
MARHFGKPSQEAKREDPLFHPRSHHRDHNGGDPYLHHPDEEREHRQYA